MNNTKENSPCSTAMRAVLHLLFPCRCVFCRQLMPLASETAVCASCMQKLPFTIAEHRCCRCGKPAEQGRRFCLLCDGRHDLACEKICAAYWYEGAVRRALVRFKRERYQSFAKVFAIHIAATVAADCREVSFDGVVSVPPRAERMRKEGYDQAEVLGRAVAKQMGVLYLGGVLCQRENRKKQSTLSERERRTNARGNYTVVKPGAAVGKCILLVDDITTTGATLQACAKALRDAGAKAVYAAAAAATRKD